MVEVNAKANLHTPDGLRMAFGGCRRYPTGACVTVRLKQEQVQLFLKILKPMKMKKKRETDVPLSGNTFHLHKVRAVRSRSHAAILGACLFDLLRRQLPQLTSICDTASCCCSYGFYCKANAAHCFMFPVRDICTPQN